MDGDYIQHGDNITVDSEIETPVLVYSRLPTIQAIVILLGTERWMANIVHPIAGLF